MKALYIYLILINIIALVIMGVDKYRAYRHRWRIPERTLYAVAILGGSVGALVGMWGFRHKTRHKGFVIGLPVILLIQLSIGLVLLIIGN